MNKAIFALSLLASPMVFSLDQQPWYGNVYEFRADAGFTYYYFNNVQGALKQPESASNNYLTFGGFGFTLSEQLDFDMDIELTRTPRQNYSFRSGALQARYRFLNDIAGDPVTLTTGFNIRGVGAKSVKDISSPYASYANFELTTAIGKEKTVKDSWKIRGYGLLSLGAACQGYPWSRYLALFESNFSDIHRLGIFSEGYFGLGGKNYVNIKHFRGWSHVQHDSIDIGALYSRVMGVWGKLMLEYSSRVFAHNYPEYEQRATIRYEIPFSLF
jgi:hypothetical protein